MVFSSYIFMCTLLPVTLVLHTVIRDIHWRNGLLIIASLVFYTLGVPEYSLLLIVSVILNYLLGLWISVSKHRRVPLFLAILFNLGLLFVFKYLGFVITEINRGFAGYFSLPVPDIEMPIGISFYTFQAMSYVVDVYRGEVKAQRNLANLLLYISFFPQLIAGPIVKYKDIESQLKQREVNSEKIRDGLLRFSAGLGKKVLIANTAAVVVDRLYGLETAGLGTAAAWIASLGYCLQIYFDFSGYSDMALGLGKILGFTFPENFNYPYISLSVREFWRRWHITLSSWFRDYLYIPLGGNKKGKFRTVLNNYIVFIATGVWHGANWTFLAFGLWHGNLMMLERIRGWLFKKKRIRILAPLSLLYTLLAVNIGFIFMRSAGITQALRMIKALFTGTPGEDAARLAVAGFLTPYYIAVFALAVIIASSLPHRLYTLLMTKLPKATCVLAMVLSLLVLALSFMQLAANSYNPFIYFQF